MDLALGPGREPFQLALIIDARPQIRGQASIAAFNIRECKIGFENRRPGCTFDLSDLATFLAIVDKRLADRFVSVDDDFR